MLALLKLHVATRRSSLLSFSVLAVFLLHASLATAVERRASRPVKSATAAAGGLVFTTASTPAPLIQCLLGANIQFRNETLTAAPDAAGTFSGGTGILGFEDGVALGTGLIADADLDALVDPETTFDATILAFEFYTEQPRTFEFQYVFASEEYSEYVGAGYDDVMAFFLNGVAATNNIARVPSTCATPGIPVSVDNVNCGNAIDPTVPAVNCGCYVDNEVVLPPPSPVNTEMDGLTQVFTATGVSIAGWNKLKIAIADSGDSILDSNVFIRCQSFVVPVQGKSWGEVKSRYR